MQTVSAEALFSAPPADVDAAIRSLIRRIWSVGDDDVLDAHPAERLVHGVPLDGETACWLTWELSAVGDATTRVRLTHDELATPAAPDPDLDGVLSMLRDTLPARR